MVEDRNSYKIDLQIRHKDDNEIYYKVFIWIVKYQAT